jgi:polyphosphate kinase 2 (PPK2 family)
VWQPRYAQIRHFEELLADTGTIIIKCCLHVSRDEQHQRFLERLDDPKKNWKFRLGDLEDRAHWEGYTEAYRDALAHTSTTSAPWYVVPSDDNKVRNYYVARLLVDALARLDLAYPRIDPAVEQAARGFA